MRPVSVVIPAYNEAQSLSRGKLREVESWCSPLGEGGEILVVDDGSDDGTPELAGEGPARVLRIPHGGKAAAIVAGIRAARGEWVLVTDMDQATPIGEAPKLLSALEAGADIAIGSRGMARRGAPPGRTVLSFGHLLLRRVLLGIGWSDTQCGFKAFRREAALDVLSNMVVFSPERSPCSPGPSVNSGFDVEFLFVAERMGFTIREIPVLWDYQETRRVGKVRESYRGLREILAIASAARRGFYPGGATR